ncbi:MAG TPA: hypothetical protein VHD56_18955 [Tepidisphaeraceae bacterium]|nr:hypothetical protein [Tepidisphaeraceae bacterium]
MWEQYRKTAIWTQTFIVLMCLGLYWKTTIPIEAILLLFFTMEVGAVIGAAWAARLKRKIGARTDGLPLQNKL